MKYIVEIEYNDQKDDPVYTFNKVAKMIDDGFTSGIGNPVNWKMREKQ